MKQFILLLLLLWSFSSSAADFPPPFTAKYTLYAAGITIGEGTRQLSQRDEDWVFESRSQTTGWAAQLRDDKIFESTRFTVAASQVRPLEYQFQQINSKKQKHVHIHFDWLTKIAKNVVDSPWEVVLNDDTLDSLLYQVVIMRDLQQGKRDLHYQVVDRGKIKAYLPEFQGEEQISTGVGKLNTLRYRYNSPDGKRQTTLWCAPKLHYLVVQVEHNENGLLIKTVLNGVSGL